MLIYNVELISLKKKLEKIIYLFLAVLGLRCRVGFSLVVESEGYSLVVVCRLLVAVASLVAELSSCDAWA